METCCLYICCYQLLAAETVLLNSFWRWDNQVGQVCEIVGWLTCDSATASYFHGIFNGMSLAKYLSLEFYLVDHTFSNIFGESFFVHHDYSFWETVKNDKLHFLKGKNVRYDLDGWVLKTSIKNDKLHCRTTFTKILSQNYLH